MRYDSIVIGTGPAGLEAALNLKIRNKSFLLIGPKDLSRKINTAPKIDNYLGLPGITGLELGHTFLSHLKNNDIAITDQRVNAMYHMGEYYSVATAEDVYDATTIILTPGVYAAKPYPGEDEFLGRGVGYCATCDAPLYKGKTVAIVGTSQEAEIEANYVAELVEKVYYIPIGPKPKFLDNNIEVITGRVEKIIGDKKATTLILKDKEVEADGFFILRESISPSTLLPGLETQDAHISVNVNMETNLPGCFAAGDCTGKPYQYIRAAGQGLTAAHGAVTFLAALDRK